jgi:hypothetical protein
MATAKEAQHDAAESLFGAIIAVLDKHEAEHSLTPEILEELSRAYAALATNVPDHPRLRRVAAAGTSGAAPRRSHPRPSFSEETAR